jgi:large subunit ribosomal protein L31
MMGQSFFSSNFVGFHLNEMSTFAAQFRITNLMKDGIHPTNYRLVVFKDMSNDHNFITRSCVNTKDTIVLEDGNTYPLVKLEITSASHPFYTGKMKLVDTAGRVDKFRTRFANHKASQRTGEE